MPRVPYVGVNDKAKKVKKMYIGIDDKARKVLKAYVGVNGVAHIFFTADWWIPYGLKEENCLAAYQFYHAANVNAANTDITGHGHNLWDTRYCTWNYDSGYYVTSGTDSSGLKASNNFGTSVVTAVFWYTGLPMASDSTLDGGRWFSCHGTSANMMAGRIGDISYSYNGDWHVYKGIKDYPGFCFSYKPYESWNDSMGYLRFYRGNSQLPSSGVVAFDRSYPQIYVNGNSIGVTYYNNGNVETINNMPATSSNGNVTIGGGTRTNTYIRAAGFFNCRLTARQHSDLAKALAEVK